MFNRAPILRILKLLEQIVTNNTNTLVTSEFVLSEVTLLRKQNQSLQSQLDEMKRRFDNLQSRQVNLMNKVESKK